MDWSTEVFGKPREEVLGILEDPNYYGKFLPSEITKAGFDPTQLKEWNMDGSCGVSYVVITYGQHTCEVVVYGERHGNDHLCPNRQSTISACHHFMYLLTKESGMHGLLEGMIFSLDKRKADDNVALMRRNGYPLKEILSCEHERCMYEKHDAMKFLRTIFFTLSCLESRLEEFIHVFDCREEPDVDLWEPFYAPLPEKFVEGTVRNFCIDSFIQRFIYPIEDQTLASAFRKLIDELREEVKQVRTMFEYQDFFTRIIDYVSVSIVLHILTSKSSSKIGLWGGDKHREGLILLLKKIAEIGIISVKVDDTHLSHLGDSCALPKMKVRTETPL